MQTFVNLTLLFSVYSCLGWICESIYCSVPAKRWINRGFLNGPFCPVYGFGALLIIGALSPLLPLYPFPLDLVLLFFAAVLLTSALEYLTSVLLEKLFHTSWWDYSQHRFQINGRVCLLNSFLFGIMSVFVLKVLHPPIQELLQTFPRTATFPVAGGLFVYFILDGTVTVIGILRMNGKLVQLQQILDEIRERTASLAENNRNNLEQSLDELRDKAQEKTSETLLSFHQALEELRLKADSSRIESLEYLRESLQELVNDELRQHLRLLRDKQEYMESDSHPIYRRMMNAFPRMRSIQSPESFQRVRQAANAAREKARKLTKKDKEL